MSYMNPTALQEQLAAAHIEIESLEQQLADSRDNERNAQRELDNAKRDIRGLRRSETARTTSTGQIQQNPVDSGPLKKEVEALQTENENLKARIQSLLTPRQSTHTQGFSCLNPPQLPRNLGERSARSDEFGGQSFPSSPTPGLSESSLNTPRPAPAKFFAAVGDTSSRRVEPASKETKVSQPPQGLKSKVVQEPLRTNAPVFEPPRPSASTKSPAMTDQPTMEELEAALLARKKQQNKGRGFYASLLSDSESEPAQSSASTKSPATTSRKEIPTKEALPTGETETTKPSYRNIIPSQGYESYDSYMRHSEEEQDELSRFLLQMADSSSDSESKPPRSSARTKSPAMTSRKETPTKQALPMGETENPKPHFGDIIPRPGSEIYDPSAQFLLEQKEAEQARSSWDPDSWSDSESEQVPPPPPKQATIKDTTGGKKEAARAPTTTASVGQSSTKGLVEHVPASAATPGRPLTADVEQAAPAVATQEPKSLDFPDNKSAFTTYRSSPMENKKRPGTEPPNDQPPKRPRTDLHET